MKVRAVLIVTLCSCHIASGLVRGQTLSAESLNRERVAWVADSLKRIQAVKPGMTRADLIKVFKLK